MNSVDAYVASVAAELGMPIIGLESIEQQLNILYNPSFEVLLAQIMSFLPPDEMLAELKESEEISFDEIAHYYEQNNLYALAHGWARTMNSGPENIHLLYTRDMLLNWRSTYYANEIARLLQETDEPTTFFVAVGLSHVIRSWGGEEFTDIVEQLELQGFTVVSLWH